MTGDIPTEIYGLSNLGSLNLGNTIALGNAFRATISANVEALTALGASAE